MSKIVYVVYWNGGVDSGVWKKIQAQVSRWTLEYKVCVYLMCNARSEANLISKGSLEVRVNKYAFSNIFGRVIQGFRLFFDVLRSDAEIVYIRDLRSEFFVPLLSFLKTTVFEINSDEDAESHFGLSKSIVRSLIRSIAYYYASGMIYVTYELKRRFEKESPRAHKIVISNGVDFKTHSTLDREKHPVPSLVFMGSHRQKWHGIDEILRLAINKPTWNFHIIGPVLDEDEVVPQNVVLYGFLGREYYTEVLKKCNVAIGTVALYRKNLEEACPLKVREYLAFGLPVIIPYIDTDLTEDLWFVLKLPNTDANLTGNISRVEQFVEKVQGRIVNAQEIEFIGYDFKEKARCAFFKCLVNE